ncbi:hypothetical protein QBC42DRAFT_248833 [Cladorrhinum samala]|uniref:Uncharacterized protein n=1 Tax=Cladorrhinum samala TaxID=585594 RepID=A0AAV9I0F3_9PEZI|nr:hypothetical protein QBC42DRAFT_248833 [Cladorrhinum samala]
MANRHFCWKVNLTFACGCTEVSPTLHSCSTGRQDCNSWISSRSITKNCEYHRKAAGLYSSPEGTDQEMRRPVSEVESPAGDEVLVVTAQQVRMEASVEHRNLEGYYLKKCSA